jgi:general secretion pathway protein F
LMDKLKREVINAAIYPALVTSLGALVTLFLLTFVVPRFARIYGNNLGDLGWATRFVLGLSSALRDHATLLLVGATLLAGLFIWLWKTGLGLTAAQTAVEGVPFIRDRARDFRLARLFRSLASLFRGGYALAEALRICQDLKLGGGIDAAVANARTQLERGKGVAQCFAAAGLTTTITERMFAAGERSGSFDQTLDIVADRHTLIFTTFIGRLTRLVEPLLLLAVAVVVGGLVVLMYMPVFDMAGGLGSR